MLRKIKHWKIVKNISTISFPKITFFLILTFHLNAFSQTDTEFWFVAPNVTNGHGNTPIFLRFSAFSTPATIFIEQPANNNFNPITINLLSNESLSVEITNQLNQIQNQPAGQVLPYGFKISSSAPIFVYYEVSHPLNPDIFSLKGRNALGLKFIIPFQNTFDNGSYSPPPRSGFDIVATEDNTTITINLTHNAINHTAGSPFTIQLNSGETYSIISESASAILRLTGSEVIASKPIAITIKDDSIASIGGCRDLNGDQIVPVNVVGKEYIVVKGFLNNNDYVYAVTTEENTEISVDGIPVTTLNNIGATFSYNLSTDAVYINSNKPIYLLHLTGYGCEVGAALLPKIECTGSRKVSFVRSTNEGFFIVLFTKSGNEGSFTLNNDTSLIPANAFSNVPGTNGLYKYARIPLSGSEIPTGVFSTVENSQGLFHLGIINGSPGGGTRYGYFSNYNAFSYNLIANAASYCEGDPLIITANSVPGASYIWTGPGNFTANGNILTINNVNTTATGTYCLQGDLGDCIIEGNCTSITVNEIITPMFSLPDAICENEQIVSFPTISNNGITGIWAPPFNNLETTTYSFTPELNSCSPAISKTILVNEKTSPEFNQIQPICINQQVIILPSISNNGISGFWSPEINNNSTTNYTFTPEANECAAVTNMTVKVIDIDTDLIPKGISPNGDGINDSWDLTALDVISIKLFNRYGSLIYSKENYTDQWTGQNMSNQPLPVGVYYYVLEIKCGTKTGWVYINK
jgi:gliding motility-associated-like protein